MPKQQQFEISITADTNDADYVTEVSKISESDLELIKPLIKAIKAFKSYKVKLKDGLDWVHTHNFPRGENVRKDLGQVSGYDYYCPSVVDEDVMNRFEELLPYGQYGIHTITDIEVTPYVKKTKLL